MTVHRMTAADGAVFEVHVGADEWIVDVSGPWPTREGATFSLEGALPDHAPAADVPDAIRQVAADTGREVCFYDPVGCRTCFCDARGRLLHCEKMC